MENYVLGFSQIDQSSLPLVGGKGANLGEMSNAGFPVPQGFCVSTSAFEAFLETSSQMDGFFKRLDLLDGADLQQIAPLAKQIREHLTSLPFPEGIATAIVEAWKKTGTEKAFAVRSSATAEDLPWASFAGQQDSFLNVRGREPLLQAVQRCWASLFTDRAVAYRIKNGFGHRSVLLSVVVQEMVYPEVSGILFTADPVTGHRHTISIDASFGLGEALVAGIVSADFYQVRAGNIISKEIAKKELAVYARPEGGTITQPLSPALQQAQALADSQILELAAIGQKVETHYGSEQDIEWAFAEKKFFILQSRPITSLYPQPAAADPDFHVFINFGYIQMMTAPMKPLAISLLSNVTNFLAETPIDPQKRILREAGGRAFADFTKALAIPPLRKRILKLLNGMDPLLASAMAEATERPDFQSVALSRKAVFRTLKRLAPTVLPVAFNVASALFLRNPAKAPGRANRFIEQKVADAEIALSTVSGAERFDFIRQGMSRMFPDVLTKIIYNVISGMLASEKLESKLKNKIGEAESARLLSKLYKSLPGNVTTEMGLQLGDLTDRARSHPELVALLQRPDHRNFYGHLCSVPGGPEFKRALDQFLLQYGARCAGEIDISVPRWGEEPGQLVSSIISNLQSAAAGDHRTKFKQGEQEAAEAARVIVSLFRYPEKIQVKRLVKLYRHLLGMREHHKFALMRLMYVYKKALLEEAQALEEKGVLQKPEDIFYLTLEEIMDLMADRRPGDIQKLVSSRKSQHRRNQQFTSPRVLTSDGEIIAGKLSGPRGPASALLGTAVSAGVAEGTARVILQAEDARLNPGEILVARFTDPGWTPLFLSAIALVTEVGGMMTHGSVVAREYGIPAVVGVEHATERIRNGDRIRVDGTNGFVEILESVHLS